MGLRRPRAGGYRLVGFEVCPSGESSCTHYNANTRRLRWFPARFEELWVDSRVLKELSAP